MTVIVCCIVCSQKRPSEVRVAATIWKKCKRAGEDSYDFSTGNFGKICTETKQIKRVKKEYVPPVEEVPSTYKTSSDHLHISEDDDADLTTTTDGHRQAEHKTVRYSKCSTSNLVVT